MHYLISIIQQHVIFKRFLSVHLYSSVKSLELFISNNLPRKFLKYLIFFFWLVLLVALMVIKIAIQASQPLPPGMIGMNYLLRMASVNCPPQERLFNRTACLQILNISLFWSKKASAAGKLHKSDWEEAPALISGDWWDECRRMTAGWLAEGCDWATLRRMKLLIQTAGETSRAKETSVLVTSVCAGWEAKIFRQPSLLYDSHMRCFEISVL